MVFARLAAMVMTLPALGEATVPAQVRLALALVMTLALAPAASQFLPPQPQDPVAMAPLILTEVAIGVGLGAAARLILSALEVAGQIAGFQTGLALAQTVNPTQGQQGAIFAAVMNATGIALIFATDLHHVFIRGILGSYTLVDLSRQAAADLSQLGLEMFVKAFSVGVQISAPLLAFGVILNVGVGVLARLMPQAQMFFVAQPVTVMLGLVVFAASFPLAMMVWLDAAGEVARILP